MRVGIPKEIKNNESRVAITPSGVDSLVRAGHDVRIERGAGASSAIPDDAYQLAGATIVDDADALWGGSELVVKVKEPIASEYRHLREDLTLFAYLHLAADRPLTSALIDSGCTAVAYETVQLADRSLPLLQPMSEVAGRLSVVVGAHSLMRSERGRGTLLGGVAGTPKADVVVIGGGVAGEHAVANALGLGADVTVIDISLPRLRALQAQFGERIRTRPSNPYEIAEAVASADLVIGSVLIPGASAPKLVTTSMVEGMKEGAVLVDIAIDQGGCFEGSRPTTHDDPTFDVAGTRFYCVANMPGAVPETSTRALTNATARYVERIAGLGWDAAAAADPALAGGLNVRSGGITNAGVAAAFAA